jgi:hypothetical protein
MPSDSARISSSLVPPRETLPGKPEECPESFSALDNRSCVALLLYRPRLRVILATWALIRRQADEDALAI